MGAFRWNTQRLVGMVSNATPLERHLGMFELPALDFVNVVTEIRRLATVLDGEEIKKAGNEQFNMSAFRERMADTTATMRDLLETIGDKSAWVAADRFERLLRDPNQALTYADVTQHIRDIESRFRDYLSFVRLFVLRNEQLPLLGSATELLGEPTASRFTSVWFDCEEAAKCLCVLRPTATVFHCMRMLEIGIRAFSARLGIPDPVSPAKRNWANFLREIKTKVESTYSAQQRMSGSEGAFMESLYATLDAVKNPWRNETMHVEGVYTDAEARFILSNTFAFIQKLATGFDENGKVVEPELLPDIASL